MADDAVTRNLDSMDELDFTGWNRADWHGAFALYPTEDVLVGVQGQPRHTAFVNTSKQSRPSSKAPAERPSKCSLIQSGSAREIGLAWSASLSAVAAW
jgi:hypothetical protein